ncbi:MAG: tetratricopeptide repeat protein [Planctomycetales bacterium]|nr:tetratricopeptide repeat protein [Planctomycetales bacterium]
MASPPKLHWSTYLWPGLPHVWTRGSWAGLGLAVGFTALANALLVVTLVWPRWLPSRVQAGGGVLLATVWLLAWLDARADWRRYLSEWASGESGDPAERSDRLYREALASYLAGDLVAAEQTITRLLKLDRRDAEARLLLATLLRRSGRATEATAELDRLEQLETAGPWLAEIAAERRRLNNITPPESDERPARAANSATTEQTTVDERRDTTSRARDERTATTTDPPAGNQAA